MTVQEVSPHIPLSKRAGGFMDRGSSSRMKTYGRNKLDECAGCLVRFVECLPLVCRIIHAPIPYQSKHPVILRKKYEIVSLIVTQLHQNMNHSGPQHVLSELRQRYWVSQVRSVIKKKIKSCCICKKYSTKPTPPLMASLPPSRFQPFSPLFYQTGVDYFGPMLVKKDDHLSSVMDFYLPALRQQRYTYVEIVPSLHTERFR